MKLKRVRFFAFLMSIYWVPFVGAQADSINTSTAKLTHHPNYFDLYSESSYYEAYDLVTDSRLRYYVPLSEFNGIKTSIYLGVGLQNQSPGSREKYFDNTANSNLGWQFDFSQWAKLQMQAGYRTVLNDDEQGNSISWDPRIILSTGRYWQWPLPENFTEVYGEAAYVPRLSSTPVSAVWAKQGYRWKPQNQISLDAYGELYVRESRRDDLGPSMTEWRLGGRAQYAFQSWSVSALLYHPIEKHQSSAELEGLFVVGGIF